MQFQYLLFEYILFDYIQFVYMFYWHIYNFCIYKLNTILIFTILNNFMLIPLFVSTNSFPTLSLEYKMQPECLGENIANVFFHRSRSILPAIDITYICYYLDIQ